MQEVHTAVNETQPRAEPETRKFTPRSRGRLKPQRLGEFQSKLRDVRAMLQSALSILGHLTMSGKVQTWSNFQLTSPCRNAKFNQMQRDLQRITVVKSTGYNTTVVAAEATQSSSIARAFRELTSPNQSSCSDTSSYVSIMAISRTRRCEPFCACQCHSRNTIQTPRWL
jgi:hypothetical protein